MVAPMDPRVAKGAASRRSATQAIMYPPEAATLSTLTVRRMLAFRRRSSWVCLVLVCVFVCLLVCVVCWMGEG